MKINILLYIKNTLFVFICFCYLNSKAQQKSIKATRTNLPVKIDASLTDSAWKNATYFSNFIEWRPSFGRIEENKTEIYLLYDNNAFYIGGYCHEKNNDSISKELVGRDAVGVNDFVGIIFDTYQDRINGFGYFVTPLGEQFDAKYSSNGEDLSWNSVFETKTKLVYDGWVFEMKIPYAAIRFVAKANQNWGFNITRKRTKAGQQFFWNEVNPGIGGNLLAQCGNLTEINNIKPPVRLSFSPYISFNANKNPFGNVSERNTRSFNGGMDVKYGINQAYTLDMTLVPDFGQVQSDNQIQNLGPFEVRFNEYRTFFTEGTELFGKGDLFYSRRIGGEPINIERVYNLSNKDSIIKNPGETKLINATKVSGRNRKGLGIGVLNALTSAQYAQVYDKTTKSIRDIETSPLINYNIFVLDQTLKYNSSISFINTNTTRFGETYDANVSAALWDFYDSKNTWQWNGKIAVSNLFGYETKGKTTSGLSINTGFGKNSGRFNFWQWHDFADKSYNQRDLGFFNNPNYYDKGLWMQYRWLKPGSWFNSLNINFDSWLSHMVMPWRYQNMGISPSANAQLKNLWNLRVGFYFDAEAHDYYEARLVDYKFIRPLQFGYGFTIRTNDAKKYSSTFSFYTGHRPSTKGFGYDIGLFNQYRFNKKFTISLRAGVDVTGRGKGFAGFDSTGTYSLSGIRNRVVAENSLNLKYNFNNVMGLTLVGRHYWSRLQHVDVKILEKDGSENILYAKETPITYFNFMNVDLTYTWQFALGSFLSINYKSITNFNETEPGYFKSLGNTLQAPQNTNFNVRIIYFLDYLDIKKKRN